MTNDVTTTTWNKDDRILLCALLDTIIPPDAEGRLPAASALDIPEFIEQRIQDTPGLAALLAQGLNKTVRLVEDRGRDDFQALSPEEREALAQELETSDPAFFAELVKYTYMGYYTHPSIPPCFGLPNRPPQPKGNDLPADDPDVLAKLLEPVRDRGNCYHAC